MKDPLIIIPARGGSKGVPGKNWKLLCDKPLIKYTLEAALEVTSKNRILVSTDSEEIRKVAESLGIKVPKLRPKALATDTTSTYDVLLYEIKILENKKEFFDSFILLQPTSPFRSGEHIKEALTLFDNNLDMVVSVKETKSNPYYVLKEENSDGFLIPSKASNYIRRQDIPKVWELNGAIYIINTQSLKREPLNKFRKVKKFVMDEVSSHDIDTMLDWQVAEKLIKDMNVQ